MESAVRWLPSVGKRNPEFLRNDWTAFRRRRPIRACLLTSAAGLRVTVEPSLRENLSEFYFLQHKGDFIE